MFKSHSSMYWYWLILYLCCSFISNSTCFLLPSKHSVDFVSKIIFQDLSLRSSFFLLSQMTMFQLYTTPQSSLLPGNLGILLLLKWVNLLPLPILKHMVGLSIVQLSFLLSISLRLKVYILNIFIAHKNLCNDDDRLLSMVNIFKKYASTKFYTVP